MQSTSQEAYSSIRQQLPSIRNQVLNVVSDAGERGVTIEEIRNKLPSVKWYSIQPRLSELAVRGKVSHHGYRRNAGGNKMVVWVSAVHQ